jgi:hypothetical protein
MQARPLVLAAAGLALAACDTTPITVPSDSPARASGAPGALLQITRRDSVLAVGDTMQLGSIATSDTEVLRDRAGVVFSSTDTTVAQVTARGLVTGVAIGTTTIAATYAWRGQYNVDSVKFTIVEAGSTAAKPATPTVTPAATPTATPTVTPAGVPTTPVTPLATPSTPATPVIPTAEGPTSVGQLPARRAGDPELPRVLLDTRMPALTGRVLPVKSGGSLQAAIDSAQYGDVISLEPGATFTGNFILRKKSGSGWIVIRSGAPDAALPAPGQRVTPQYAPAMPKILSPNSLAAIRTASGAHHYRLIALEVSSPSNETLNNGLVQFGNYGTEQDEESEVASWLVLDRSYVHGHANLHVKRCVSLNAASSAVIDSHLDQCHGRGQDTQAIFGYNGPGPFKIVNNYLADAAEVIMFGGADPNLKGVIPSDIEIRRNQLRNSDVMKLTRAEGGGWLVKNLLELKSAQRVWIEGNVLEDVWPAGQKGFGLVFKSVNQSGTCSWCAVRHVTVRGNLLENMAGGAAISVIDVPTNPLGEYTNNVLLRDNVFRDIDTYEVQMLGPVFKVTIDHNSGDAKAMFLSLEGDPKRDITLTNNIFGKANYSAKMSGVAVGLPSLTRGMSSYVFTGNALVGERPDIWPSGNFFPANADEAATLGATDGARVGPDQALVEALTAGVRSMR